MRNTKTVRNILLVILLTMCCLAQAQPGGDADTLATKLTNWMKTTLALSDEQVSQVQEINQKYAEKMYALQRKTIPRRQKLEILKDNDAAKENELKKVFTVDQFKLYQAKKEELKKQMKQKAKEKKKGT
jgi:hypothetical protein